MRLVELSVERILKMATLASQAHCTVILFLQSIEPGTRAINPIPSLFTILDSGQVREFAMEKSHLMTVALSPISLGERNRSTFCKYRSSISLVLWCSQWSSFSSIISVSISGWFNRVLAAADIKNINYFVKTGDLDSSDTIDFLLKGGMLLVPYDADVNHSPALKNGHTAHWCVVSGVIIINKPKCPLNMPSENVYVLCRHGKSKFLAAWNLTELARSNKNLWEFSPKKQSDNLQYVQPKGGLGGENGLRSQYLMFNWS